MSRAKARFSEDYEVYTGLLTRAQSHIKDRNFREALDSAEESWSRVDGLVQYRSKVQQRETRVIETFDLVLDYAPPLFDWQRLDRLKTLIEEKRGTTKQAVAGYPPKIDAANVVLQLSRVLWDHYEMGKVDLPVTDLVNPRVARTRFAEILAFWLETGLAAMQAEIPRIFLVTVLSEPWKAVCIACGNVDVAPKREFFDSRRCPFCMADSIFVLKSRACL